MKQFYEKINKLPRQPTEYDDQLLVYPYQNKQFHEDCIDNTCGPHYHREPPVLSEELFCDETTENVFLKNEEAAQRAEDTCITDAFFAGNEDAYNANFNFLQHSLKANAKDRDNVITPLFKTIIISSLKKSDTEHREHIPGKTPEILSTNDFQRKKYLSKSFVGDINKLKSKSLQLHRQQRLVTDLGKTGNFWRLSQRRKFKESSMLSFRLSSASSKTRRPSTAPSQNLPEVSMARTATVSDDTSLHVSAEPQFSNQPSEAPPDRDTNTTSGSILAAYLSDITNPKFGNAPHSSDSKVLSDPGIAFGSPAINEGGSPMIPADPVSGFSMTVNLKQPSDDSLKLTHIPSRDDQLKSYLSLFANRLKSSPIGSPKFTARRNRATIVRKIHQQLIRNNDEISIHENCEIFDQASESQEGSDRKNIPFSSRKMVNEDGNSDEDSYENDDSKSSHSPIKIQDHIVFPTTSEIVLPLEPFNPSSAVSYSSPARKLSVLSVQSGSGSVEIGLHDSASAQVSLSPNRRTVLTERKRSIYAPRINSSIDDEEITSPSFGADDEFASTTFVFNDQQHENQNPVLATEIEVHAGEINEEDFDNVNDWLAERMKQIISEIQQPLSHPVREFSPKRLLAAEIAVLFKGFQVIDELSRDCVISVLDLTTYCKTFKVPLSEKDLTFYIWLMDDNRNSTEKEPSKVREPTSERRSNSYISPRKLKSKFKEELVVAKPIFSTEPALASDIIVFFRLLFFVAFADIKGSVHLMSVLQIYLGLYGSASSERFSFVYLRDINDLTDSDRIDVATFIKSTVKRSSK